MGILKNVGALTCNEMTPAITAFKLIIVNVLERNLRVSMFRLGLPGGGNLVS